MSVARDLARREAGFRVTLSIPRVRISGGFRSFLAKLCRRMGRFLLDWAVEFGGQVNPTLHSIRLVG